MNNTTTLEPSQTVCVYPFENLLKADNITYVINNNTMNELVKNITNMFSNQTIQEFISNINNTTYENLCENVKIDRMYNMNISMLVLLVSMVMMFLFYLFKTRPRKTKENNEPV